MKRKVGDTVSEDEGPSSSLDLYESQQPIDKKRRCDHAHHGVSVTGGEGKENDSRRRSCKQWSCDASKKDVTVELLEDMGVNILEENSRDSLPIPRSNAEINLVLAKKDPNVTRNVVGPSGDVGESGDDSFNSQDSFDCSISYIAPERAKTLSNHSYAVDTTDPTVPDEFFTYAKKRAPHLRRDVFMLMSDEVVLHVFRWLPKCTLARCALVCKRWRRLSLDESLWKRLDLGLKTLPPGVLGQVLARGCSYLRLARATMAPSIFKSLSLHIPTYSSDLTCKLQYMDLSMASITVTCLENLLATCRILKKLALENCEVSDKVCRGIAQNKNLEVLHLGMTQGLSPAGVTSVLTGCPALTELNLGWTGLSEQGVRAVCENLKPQLERLNISGNRDTLQDSHTFLIVSNAPNLRELDLSDATKITAVSLDLVVEYMKKVESLSTSRCYGISPSSYLILASCPSLLYLNVFGLLRDPAMVELRARLQGIEINKFLFTSIARPTVGIRRTSIWNLRVRE